jgi:hypothetical protein
MSISGIYIDDSGNPGAEAPSIFLPESRKSWAAVIIPESIANDIEQAMSIFLGGIMQDYGLSELHFTDIYSGRGIWKKVSVAERMKIFDLMTMLVAKFNLPVFYQTFSDEFRKDYSKRWDQISDLNIEFWDFKRTAHISLFLILIQLRDAIPTLRKQSGDFGNTLDIIVDAGLAKSSALIQLPFSGNGNISDSIKFEQSNLKAGLQIADFVAFVISKSQRIMFEKGGSKDFLDKDLHILNIIPKLNHWTLDLMKVDQNKFSKEGYEFFLQRDRVNKGLTKKPLK